MFFSLPSTSSCGDRSAGGQRHRVGLAAMRKSIVLCNNDMWHQALGRFDFFFPWSWRAAARGRAGGTRSGGGCGAACWAGWTDEPAAGRKKHRCCFFWLGYLCLGKWKLGMDHTFVAKVLAQAEQMCWDSRRRPKRQISCKTFIMVDI